MKTKDIHTRKTPRVDTLKKTMDLTIENLKALRLAIAEAEFLLAMATEGFRIHSTGHDWFIPVRDVQTGELVNGGR